MSEHFYVALIYNIIDSSNKRPRIDDASEDTFTLMHIKQETKAEPQTTEGE